MSSRFSASRRMWLKWGGSVGAMTGLGTALGGCGLFDDDDKKTVLPGRRIDVLSTGAGLRVDRQDTQHVVLPPVQNVRSWMQNGRIPSHEAVNALWSGKFRQSWSMSVGSAVDPGGILPWIAVMPHNRGMLQSPPLVGNGRLFSMDAHGYIKVWSWPGRSLQWTLQPAKKTKSTNLGGGMALDGATLYIVDGVASALAVDAVTGREKWRVNIGTPGRSAPTVADGIMVFTTIDERLYALDARTGRQLWMHPATEVSTSIFGEAAPAVVNGVVLAGFGSGDLVALRLTSGELLWSDTLGGGNGLGAMLDFACVRGAPVIVDGTVYAISMSQVMVAIDMRSGRRLWEREVSGQNPLCVCGNWLYVISLDQQLACLDRMTGHVRWVTQLRRFEHQKKQKGGVFWFGPLLVNNRLVCFSSLAKEGGVQVNAITGEIEKTIKLPEGCQVQPMICDGRIMIITQDGVLRAYE